jgi:hypothetical protein
LGWFVFVQVGKKMKPFQSIRHRNELVLGRFGYKRAVFGLRESPFLLWFGMEKGQAVQIIGAGILGQIANFLLFNVKTQSKIAAHETF